MKGKLGSLLMKFQNVEYHLSVYDELISFLSKEDLEIFTASDPGTVPAAQIKEVRDELAAHRESLAQYLAHAEEVEIEHGIKDPGGFRPADRPGR